MALPLPEEEDDRALVLAIRRMATLGLRDASAALLIIGVFGAGFRRPLVLLRAFVLELSATARKPIRFARCCTPAMTEDERAILELLVQVAHDFEGAEQAVAKLTGNPHVGEPLSAAAVFARAAGEHARRRRLPQARRAEP
jgi:hypothetical protein